MKRSATPTNHVLIKVNTAMDLDIAQFAIITLTEEFRKTLHQCLYTSELFSSDDSFHNLAYWDCSCSYYSVLGSDLHTETAILPEEDWIFIHLERDEEQALLFPENNLEGHQLVIAKHGRANFKALSKYTDEEYTTETFSIKELLKN